MEQTHESVAERVLRVRQAHPLNSGWCITSDVTALPELALLVFRVGIKNPEDVTVAQGVVVQSARISVNAESLALGRALFYAGFGQGDVMTSDELMVQAEPTPETDSALIPKLKQELESRLKARGLRTNVHMLQPGTLERTEFKARRVIDKRNL